MRSAAIQANGQSHPAAGRDALSVRVRIVHSRRGAGISPLVFIRGIKPEDQQSVSVDAFDTTHKSSFASQPNGLAEPHERPPPEPQIGVRLKPHAIRVRGLSHDHRFESTQPHPSPGRPVRKGNTPAVVGPHPSHRLDRFSRLNRRRPLRDRGIELDQKGLDRTLVACRPRNPRTVRAVAIPVKIPRQRPIDSPNKTTPNATGCFFSLLVHGLGLGGIVGVGANEDPRRRHGSCQERRKINRPAAFILIRMIGSRCP